MKDVGSLPLVTYSRKEYPEYHDYLSTLMGGKNRRLRIVEEHDDGVALVTALETGAGVAILPQSLAQTTGARIKLIPIVPEPPPLVVGAAWTPAGIVPLAERFLSVARACARVITDVVE